MTLETLKKKIALGTVQLGLKYGINNVAGKPAKSEAFRILDRSLQSNVNTLDTADAYGDAIEVIGEYLKSNSGANFNIISKFIYDGSPLDEKLSTSLNSLGCKSLYGYMYHRISDYRSRYYMNDLLRLKHEGRIERIGTSVYGVDELEVVVEDPDVDLIQIPFNALDLSDAKVNLLEKAKKSGKEVHVRSIFLQGLFFKKPHELSGNLRGLEQPLREFHEVIGRFDLNVNQVCLNHALHSPLIDKVIIGVETVSQLEENLGAVIGDFPSALSDQLKSIRIPNTELLNPTNWEP